MLGTAAIINKYCYLTYIAIIAIIAIIASSASTTSNRNDRHTTAYLVQCPPSPKNMCTTKDE